MSNANQDYRGELNQGPGGSGAVQRSWSASGPMTTGSQDKVVALQQPFPEPGIYTVTFALDPLQANLNAAGIRAQALIKWSVAGNTITRLVNVGDGVSVSGLAEAVSVVVQDVTCLQGTISAQAGFNYSVGIMVAKGTRPYGSLPPTLSPFPFQDFNTIGTQLTVAAGANTAIIPIPRGVGVTCMHVDVYASNPQGSVVPDGTPVVAQYQFMGGGPIRFYDPRAIDWAPIQPGSTGIVLFNFSSTLQLTFSLVWGIDG